MLKRMVTLGAVAFVVAVMTSISGQWPERVLSAEVNTTPTALDPTIVGYWKLDEGTGTIAQDSSGKGNDGTLTNGPMWSTGQLNGALQFDGIDDYVAIPSTNEFDTQTALTLSAWMNPDNVSSSQFLLSKHAANGNWESFSFRLQSNGTVRFSVQNADVDAHPDWISTTTLSPGTWYHIVFSWERVTGISSDAKVFINGVEEGATFQGDGYTPSFTMGFSASNPVAIGRRERDTPTHYFEGLIDDVRIYNRALSSSEVVELAFQ